MQKQVKGKYDSGFEDTDIMNPVHRSADLTSKPLIRCHISGKYDSGSQDLTDSMNPVHPLIRCHISQAG